MQTSLKRSRSLLMMMLASRSRKPTTLMQTVMRLRMTSKW